MEGRKNNVIISGINGDRDAETNVKMVLSKLDIEGDICKVTVLPTFNTKNVIIVGFPREELKKQALEKRKKVTLTQQACDEGFVGRLIVMKYIKLLEVGQRFKDVSCIKSINKF
nr:unnamed protein product [Callosobruchus analis]